MALIMWTDTFRTHIGMLRHNHISNTVSLEWGPGRSQSLSVSSSQYHIKHPVPAGNSKRKLIIIVSFDS